MSLLAPASFAPVADRVAGRPVVVSGLHVDRGGHRVLEGVNLDVAQGSTLALLGPSGCGKTTLLRAVAGLDPVRGGNIVVGDRTLVGDGVQVPAERRNVGMVFQDWALFPHLSVGRNVAFGLRRRDARRDIVTRALALVDLVGTEHRMPSTLSGGQQQRVAIARALATRPDVLLLDEPFSNLDAGLREQVRGEVAMLLRDLRITTILVTHDQEEAFLLGDQVAVMLDGRIHQQDTPTDLYQHPASRAVAQFLGHANLVPGEVSGNIATTRIGAIPVLRGTHGRAVVLVRPEHLHLTPDAAGADQVEDVRYYGHDAVCRVVGPDGAPYDVRTLSAPVVRVGDRVTVRYDGPDAPAYAE